MIPPTEPLKILQRCGIVLIVVGAMDIAYMIWCIANGRSYSSSFNVFAVVGGILLFRGGLKTARWVAQMSTFMLVASVGALLTLPFIFPLGYWLATVRHGSGMMTLVSALTLIAVLAWLRQQLMRPEVQEALHGAGLPPPRIKRAMAAGVALALLVAPLMGWMLRGETAHEAIRRAQQQLGGDYQYVVTSLQMQSATNGASVSAVVAAYNATELKNLQISWKE